MEETTEVCYRTVTEERERVCKTCIMEPVWTEKCVKVCTGDWQTEKEYCRRASVFALAWSERYDHRQLYGGPARASLE